MKKIYSTILSVTMALTLSSCVELNLNPLSEGSSGNWFSSPEEFEMATSNLYKVAFYQVDNILWGDDAVNRANVPGYYTGGITSENSDILTSWKNYYKGITRSLKVIGHLDQGREMGISESKLNQYAGESYFYIGYAYGSLAFHWGDVVLYKEEVSLDDSYTLPRSPKREVLDFAYECFDRAAELLPTSYSGIQRATKGAAYAFKARAALYNGDYAIAAEAAKKCMDLKVYSLHKDYPSLFTANYSNEWIFFFKGDVGLKIYYTPADDLKNLITRCSGGWGGYNPSYELFYAYPCIDGLPVDKSPLFDPKDPWANRDPRLAYTIVPFATAKRKAELGDNYKPSDYQWLDYEYTPDPNTTQVMKISTGKKVTNTDSKACAEHAAYNGLILKKFVDADWLDNNFAGSDNPMIYMRYGDVLLMYAEAMIELGNCTQEILDNTINKLRERAYVGSGLEYPRLMMGSQQELRTALRTERFIELAWEQHRQPDLYRWRIAEKFGNTPQYYLSRSWSGNKSWNGDRSKVSAAFRKLCENWDEGNYPTGGTPKIDENGIADLSYMVDAGYIVVAAERRFDPKRDYLWPIPAADIMVNPNLTQNPGY